MLLDRRCDWRFASASSAPTSGRSLNIAVEFKEVAKAFCDIGATDASGRVCIHDGMATMEAHSTDAGVA